MPVSVLTPTYNYGRFLSDAMVSVAEQQGVEAEHVVIDGASEDETARVLAAAPPNVVWRSEPDAGQADALNKALALATGDWIAWLNADEFYLPDALRGLVRCAEAHPDAALVYGDAVFVDVDGQFLRLVAQHSFSLRVLRWNRCNISSCAILVRRDAIAGRGWDSLLRATMDWDLYLEIARQGGRIVYLPQPIGCFRVHPDQITAERLPTDHPDFARLQWRHRRPSGIWAPVANRVGELEHRILKVAEGGLAREAKLRTLRHADLRWFDSATAKANAVAVLAKGSARGPGIMRRLGCRTSAICRPEPL